jgi:hypothetical protein
MDDEMAGRVRGIRIGDAERETAAEALGTHLRAGRLTVGEYDERMEQAFAARTAGEIEGLFGDLPEGSPLRSSGPISATPRVRAYRGFPVPGVIAVLLIAGAVAWSVTTHLPPFFLLPVLIFALARRRFSYGPSRFERRYR